MKPYILILCLSLLNLSSFSQNIDSLGLNSSPELNSSEVKYFNSQTNKPDSFDFKNKRVGFFYYNNGSTYITKKEYFDKWGKEYLLNNHGVMNQLLVLTPIEKGESGGYDIIIVSWSKLKINEKDKPRLIRKLKRKTQVK